MNWLSVGSRLSTWTSRAVVWPWLVTAMAMARSAPGATGLGEAVCWMTRSVSICTTTGTSALTGPWATVIVVVPLAWGVTWPAVSTVTMAGSWLV